MFFIHKSSAKIHWTNHVKIKMRFYKLSEQRVRRILNSPKRTEEGIAPNTVALMQVAGSEKHPYEIWVMLQKINQKSDIKSQMLKVISAWKYPGRTKPRGEIAFNFIQQEFAEYKNEEKSV